MTRCQGAFFFQVWYLLSICLSINISDDQSMPYSLSIPQYQLPISICSWCSRPTCWLATRKWSSHWNLKRLQKSTYSRAISKALRMWLEDLKFSYTFRFTFGKHVYHGHYTALTCKFSTQPTCDSDDVFAVLWPLHAADTPQSFAEKNVMSRHPFNKNIFASQLHFKAYKQNSEN